MTTISVHLGTMSLHHSYHDMLSGTFDILMHILSWYVNAYIIIDMLMHFRH